MGAGFFNTIACLIGEFAEIYFPGVRRKAKHVNVRARAKEPVFRAGYDHGTNLRMLETNTLKRVVEFNIDAEIVGVELGLVAGPGAAIRGYVHGEGGNGAIERKAPVLVARGIGAKV